MILSDYQTAAALTSGAYGDGISANRSIWAAISLGGEVGELLNLIKKKYNHGHDIPVEKLLEEIGDCLWYLSEFCSAVGASLDEVARHNLAKLQDRYPAGFSEKASINRE